MVSKKLYTLLLPFLLLGGCTSGQLYENPLVEEAKVNDRTRASDLLFAMPEPENKIAVALYDFQDQTGQFKNNGNYTDYSSAVTKGGHAILTKALLDAGSKKWFTVTERGSLKDLLQERQLIKLTRAEYSSNGEKLPQLPPMIYSGMLIEGGIVSYDSNIVTGGAGATYLGIGGDVKYNRDLVTVYLRAVSIQTGEVLLSVTSSKTLFSTAVDTNILKYITYDRLFQAEAGFTVNEPTQLCVRQAIETAVYSLVMEGALSKIWNFKDTAAGQRALAEYTARRDGTPAPEVAAAKQPQPEPQAMKTQPMADTAQAVPVQPVTQQRIAPPQQTASRPQPAASQDEYQRQMQEYQQKLLVYQQEQKLYQQKLLAYQQQQQASQQAANQQRPAPDNVAMASLAPASGVNAGNRYVTPSR